MKFSEKIVRLRKNKGLTQEEFAEAVGVSRQAVYKWECGQSYPEVAKLLEIKLLFGISIDDLLDENYEVAVPEKKRKKRQNKPTESEPVTAVEKNEISTVSEEEPVTETVAPEVQLQEAAPVVEKPLNKEKKRGFFSRLFGRK